MKRLISLLLGLCVVFCIGGCSPDEPGETTASVTPTETTEIPEFDLDEYMGNVELCLDSIIEAEKELNYAYTYQISLWKSRDAMGLSPNYEKLISSTNDWLLEKKGYGLSKIESSYVIISESYKQIVTTEISGETASEIESILKDLFDSYNGLYNLVLNPIGSRQDFSDNCQNFANSISLLESELRIFLN